MSESPTPRRALPDDQRSKKPLIIGGAVVAAAAVTAADIAIGTRGGSSGAVAGATASASPSASAVVKPSNACEDSITLAVDPVWFDAMTAVSKSWPSGSKDGCNPIALDPKDSSEIAASGLGEDVAWIPEDATWAVQAKDSKLKVAKPVVVGNSPLVIVNQPDAAKSLGQPLNPKTLAQMLTAQRTWAQHGHTDWGTLKLVLPKVDTTVAGAAAFGSLANQAATLAPVAAPAGIATPQQTSMAKVQQRLVAQVATKDVTDSLGTNPADASGITPASPRTGVTTEALALADGGAQASLLDGRSGLQMSVVDPSGNETVKKFSTWLTTTEGQKALAAAGVRTATQTPDAAALGKIGLPAQGPKVVPNDIKNLMGARQLLAASSKRTAAMLVLDTSGSMAQPLDGTSPMRKIDIVLQMALSGWSAWPPGMATGLMTFNATNDASERTMINTVVPLMRTDSSAWVKASKQYQGALKQVQVTGGTPLYQAIAQSQDYMKMNYVEGMSNKLIVVTDGSSQDAAGEPTLDALLAKLPKTPDEKKPIQVIYLALGADADFEALQKIAKATNQTAVQISSMAELTQKMPLLFS